MIKIRCLILPTTKLLPRSCSSSAARTPQETKVTVGDCDINYVKVGTGEHKVLCLPGALGTIWTDFKPQLEGFDHEKFTIVAWDAPGYGKSRPPEKEFTPDFYQKDALYASEFMKVLGFPKYSVLGWSDGGTTGMILAAQNPQVVQKLVIWGSNAFILPLDLEISNKTRDIKSWSPRMRQPMIDVYGEDYFAKLWSKWCDGIETIFKVKKGEICSQILKNIKCPTFILHGEKDFMLDNVHVSHLHTHIKGARLHLYPDGKHNIHLRYADDFNKRVQDFLQQREGV